MQHVGRPPPCRKMPVSVVHWNSPEAMSAHVDVLEHGYGLRRVVLYSQMEKLLMKQERVGSEIFTQEPQGDDGIAICRCQIAHLSLFSFFFFSLFSSFHIVCMQTHGVDRYDVQDCRNRTGGLFEDIVPDTGRASLFAPDFISAPTLNEQFSSLISAISSYFLLSNSCLHSRIDNTSVIEMTWFGQPTICNLL